MSRGPTKAFPQDPQLSQTTLLFGLGVELATQNDLLNIQLALALFWHTAMSKIQYFFSHFFSWGGFGDKALAERIMLYAEQLVWYQVAAILMKDSVKWNLWPWAAEALVFLWGTSSPTTGATASQSSTSSQALHSSCKRIKELLSNRGLSLAQLEPFNSNERNVWLWCRYSVQCQRNDLFYDAVGMYSSLKVPT